MTVLRRHFRDAPNPSSFIVTRWVADPFSRGSYSHLPPGCSGATYEQMAAAEGQRLFWAGEATIKEYPSTVHGAHLSGLRAADQVASVVKLEHTTKSLTSMTLQ